MKLKIYKAIFIILLLGAIILITLIAIKQWESIQNEKENQEVLETFSNIETQESDTVQLNGYNIIGIVTIPKIDIQYPILAIETSNPEETKEPKDSEEYGEVFDTSIIDSIDDEEVETPKNNIEETMVFNNPPIEKNEENTLEEKVEDVDPIMDELNNLDTTETDFEGFSISSKDNSKEEVKEEKKPHKRYTKIKKSSSSADDFLAQMEENLKNDKKERDARKSKK